MERLEQMGFRVKMGDAVAKRHIYTAGTVEERLADLHGLFADDDVAGVICARGGAGAGWLLPRLDLDLLRGHFKPFIGYSDVTYLHLVFNALALVTFHGPMVAWEFALGLSSGHVTGPNVTLPLGVRARLRGHGEEARFEILEASVE